MPKTIKPPGDSDIDRPCFFCGKHAGWRLSVDDGPHPGWRCMGCEQPLVPYNLRAVLAVKDAEIARLRDALQFYADREHLWFADDGVELRGYEDGGKARAALELEPPHVEAVPPAAE